MSSPTPGACCLSHFLGWGYLPSRRPSVRFFPFSEAPPTGEQRPDIVLRFRHDSWPDLVVVLDAKYRLDASDEYVKQYGSPGPPQDAVSALHRYRDAIVEETTAKDLERPVVKGAALFPLNAHDSTDFPSSRLNEALDRLGIGALPFLPGNTGHVRSWLEQLLTMPPQKLAEPGPPSAGLERMRTAPHSVLVKDTALGD